ncbi:MAG: agmatinase [Elusimicrobia bacterium]|nr:agmatinase [Elusimicrobiota bacterium]
MKLSWRVRRPLSPYPEVLPGKFMGVDAPLRDARFLVLPLPYEKTTSYKKGTERGPEKFIEGSLGVELWDEELGMQTYQAGIHTLPILTSPEPADKFFPRLQAEVERLARLKDKTLFCVGGEHSLSQATIPAFAKFHPGLSVLHFDAHADLRPEYEGSPHNHACALYPASRFCRIVQIGIRSIGEEEAHIVDAGRVKTIPLRRPPDLPSLIREVLRSLGKTVYLSIDLDGFDPAVIPGVGTPQPGGFSWFEGIEIFRQVIAKKTVVGIDIMELCPLQDTVHSELAAAKLAYRLMGYLRAKDSKLF